MKFSLTFPQLKYEYTLFFQFNNNNNGNDTRSLRSVVMHKIKIIERRDKMKVVVVDDGGGGALLPNIIPKKLPSSPFELDPPPTPSEPDPDPVEMPTLSSLTNNKL